MSLLNKLKQKKKERLTQKHPLFDEEISIKYPYCIGVAMQAYIEDELGEKEDGVLEDLVYCMGLSEDYLEKIKEAARSEDEDLIDGVIEILGTREKKYMFILDLYKVSYADGTVSAEEKEAINIFSDMLHLEGFEKEFLENFAEAIVKNSNELACSAYEVILLAEVEISFNLLKYFMAKFEYVQKIDGYTLKTGEVLVLNKPCVINGSIVVPSGARLVIDGANIELSGNIEVDGGQVSINNSYIKAIVGCLDTMFTFENISKVEINKTTFDGNRISGAICQKDGVLEINESKITNTNGAWGVYFDGNMCRIRNCKFYDCVINGWENDGRGGGLYIENGQISIEKCEFNDCEANSGGAIFNRGRTLKVENCNFSNCSARDNYGSAISNFCGSVTIKECTYNNCTPSNNVLSGC